MPVAKPVNHSEIRRPSTLDHILAFMPIPVIAEIKAEKILEENILRRVGERYPEYMKILFHSGLALVRYIGVPAIVYLIVDNYKGG